MSLPLGISLMGLFIIISFVWATMSRETALTRWFGPESTFLWGDEAQAYASREQTRRNVLWGVIIAFLVSVAESIVVSLMFLSAT